MTEFERVRAASVKISAEVLRYIAISLVQIAEAPCVYAPSLHEGGLQLASKATSRWIQEFMEANNLVNRRQTGKPAVSPEKQLYIEKSVAYHLGELKKEI